MAENHGIQPDPHGFSTDLAKEDHTWTHDELLAIASLQRLGKRWPRSLTLLSTGSGGSLTVVPTSDYVDDTLTLKRAYMIEGIPNDGGDPDWHGDD